MITPISERKTVELSRKLGSLDDEFDHWLKQSEEDQPFQKHHTQIRAVTEILNRLRAQIKTKLGSVKDDNQPLAQGRAVEEMILAVHRIWEYFRSKLSQRYEDRFKQYLAAADEFAWACYKPALDATAATDRNHVRREPPLVFFNGGASPFSVSRDRAFEAEQVPGEPLSGPALKKVLESLPIPVIGVPWHQVAHLPDALVIGHEVGHTVEDDFKLTSTLEERLGAVLVRGVDQTRHAAWKNWLGEIFADLYGCLAAGPAFVSALMDFLAGAPATVAAQTRTEMDWGLYPTDYLRIVFNLAALRALGFAAESDRLEQNWQASYPSHSMTCFAADAKLIAPALLDVKYAQLGGRSLREIVIFSAKEQKRASEVADDINRQDQITKGNIRELFAAIRLAYERAPTNHYATEDIAKNISLRMDKIIEKKVRAGEKEMTKEQKDIISEQRKNAGDDLFDQMWAAAHSSGAGGN